jgi:hypothetical protein
MAEARLIVVVNDKGDAGREVYRGVFEALRARALKAAETRVDCALRCGRGVRVPSFLHCFLRVSVRPMPLLVRARATLASPSSIRRAIGRATSQVSV